MLELPSERPLEGTEGSLEDEGFALNRNILQSFCGSNLTVNKSVFNYHLCRAPWYVECAFGILSNEWRIFQRPLNVSPDLAGDIVKACAFLQSFSRERDDRKFQDALTVPGLEDVRDGQSVHGGLTANSVKNMNSRVRNMIKDKVCMNFN